MVKIKVIKNKENPEPTPVLAEAIIKISEAMEDLAKTDLNERAIVVLIQDACPAVIGNGYNKRKPTKKEIKAVLDSMKQLKGWYCREK